MSTALAMLGSPQDMIAKTQAFKEMGALVESGFLPAGFTSVKQVMVVCWQADALGVHPMVMLQNCTIIHQRPYFSWRLKWGLISSRYPQAEMETVRQDETVCVVRARKSPESPWQEVTFTREQCRKNPVTSKNPLYEQDWPDMSYKACVHRLCDRLAPEVLLGLPSGELQAIDDVPTDAEPGPKPGASIAEVMSAAAGTGQAGTADAKPSGGVGTAEATAPPAPRDFTAECMAMIDRLWGLKGKGAAPKRREVCELVLSELRGTKVKLTAGLAPSESAEILEYLNKTYPNGKRESGAEEGGGQVRSGQPDSVSSEGSDASASTSSGVMGFDEQHAAGLAEGEYEVPLGEPAADPDVDPVAEAAKAAEQARFDADGLVATIFDIADAAPAGVPVIQEAPKGSKAFYLVHFDVMKARGRTNGRLIQKDGEQKIDAEECRALVGLLRERGLMGTVERR